MDLLQFLVLEIHPHVVPLVFLGFGLCLRLGSRSVRSLSIHLGMCGSLALMFTNAIQDSWRVVSAYSNSADNGAPRDCTIKSGKNELGGVPQ